MMINKMVFAVAEAAAILSYSSQTVYHLIHTRQLFAYKDEGRKAWRIPEKAIEDYLNARMARGNYV